jgi:hypothetical protein
VAHCFAGCQAIEITKRIAELLAAGAALPDPEFPVRLKETREHRDAVFLSLYQGYRELEGSLSQQYLRRRGIDLETEKLKHHPAAYHKETGLFAPAMIGIVEDLWGQVAAFHRTWIDPTTAMKAPFSPVRKMFGRVRGFAVHLMDDATSDTVFVSEGIENAASFAMLRGWRTKRAASVWAALSASGIASLQIPAGIKKVVVIGDRDQACRDAVNKLAGRLYRKASVSVEFPSSGRDFNEMLMGALDA